MHYVYLLQSQKDGTFYVGSTGDLKRRFYQHNQSRSIATKAKVPWKLVYYEAYGSKAHALKRERALKHHGKGIAVLKKRLGF